MSSSYYTAAWGSPYEFSPDQPQSLRSALAEQQPPSDNDFGEPSPGPSFGLEHLIPNRLSDLDTSQTSTAPNESPNKTPRANKGLEDHLITPRSRTRRWVQLPEPDTSEKVHWWSDESSQSVSENERSGGPSEERQLPGRRQQQHRSLRQHKSREDNKTIDQQSFWTSLRERQSERSMSSLFASRWAATPPPEPETDPQPIPARSPPKGEKSEPTPTMSPPMDEEPEQPISALSLPKESDFEPLPAPESPTEDGTRVENDGYKEEDVEKQEDVQDSETPPKIDAPPEIQIQEDSKADESLVEQSDEPLSEPTVPAVDESENTERVVPDPVLDKPEVQSPEPSTPVVHTPDNTQPELSEAAFDKPEIRSPESSTPPVAEQPAAIVEQEQPSDSVRLEPPKLKKRVSWRGKNIVIAIPHIDFHSPSLRMPMSRDEVEERLKQFEQAGYNIKGFDQADESISHAAIQDGGDVQVKPVYPDETEGRVLPSRDQLKVLLPDLDRWRAYTDWLTEQKLAALGVMGPEEPVSAQSSNMSRQSSGQYPPLPFSPPIPTASAASIGRPPIVRGHSHTMSLASPTPPLNSPFGHMHRQSSFTGGFGFPRMGQTVQQSVIPGMRSMSPQQPPGFSGVPHSGSPAQFSTFGQDFGSFRGPGSPLNQNILARDVSGGFAENQRSQDAFSPPVRQIPTPTASMSQLSSSLRPTPILPELPEDDDEEELRESPPPAPAYVPPQKRVQANTEIAVPTPRGHRHNISEGLERDLLEAENRQSTAKRDWGEIANGDESQDTSITEEQKPIATVDLPQPDPVLEKDPLSQDYVVQESTHTHKKSGSRFNVTAPTFTFNPAGSFHPPKSGFSFQPSVTKMNVQTTTGHTRNQSSGSMNVNAPSFNPTTGPAVPPVPRSDFSFSASIPSLQPNAPTFEPAAAHRARTSIFGKFSLPNIIKPSRRSKAVAIVPPEESKTVESAPEYEDEEGRIAQGDAKRKQRKTDDDGDEVPQFAEPPPAVALPPPPVEKILPSQSIDVPPTVEEVEDQTDVVPEETVKDVMGEDDQQPPKDPTPGPESHSHKRSTSLSALAPSFEPPSISKDVVEVEDQNVDQPSSLIDLEDGEIEEDDSRADSPVQGPGIPQLIPMAGTDPADYPIERAAVAEPSFDEIDAVMRQLNAEEPSEEFEEQTSPARLPSPGSHPMKGVTYLPEWTRSDAPSPSPRRRPQPVVFSANQTDSEEPDFNASPRVTRLNKADEAATSDWSGVLSPPDEEKLHQRSMFFDNHIDTIIGRVVEQRLRPLEESLRGIYSTVNKRNRSSEQQLKRTSSNIESDADDEDDLSEALRHRPVSRGRDKRIDQIKNAVLEAMREQSPKPTPASNDLSELHSVLADMKVSFARAASASLELDDIRAVVDDVMSRQQQPVPMPTVNEESNESHRRELSELEGRLNETLAGALEEANRRRDVEEREAETRRLLRVAEEEGADLRRRLERSEDALQSVRDFADEHESKARDLTDERSDLLDRIVKSEEVMESLRDTASKHESNARDLENERADLMDRLEKSEHARRHSANEHESQTRDLEDERQDLVERLEQSETARHASNGRLKEIQEENEALQETLEEYRLSSNRWRQESEKSKREHERLEKKISLLEEQAQHSQESNDSMKRRLAKLYTDMSTASGQLASERSLWKSREENYRSRCAALEAQHAAQARERAQLEEEIRIARSTVMESSEGQHALEQLQSSNVSLEEVVRKLRNDLTEQSTLAVRFEQQFHDAEESGRAEVNRVRTAMDTELESANLQVKIARAELESELSRVRTELESSRIEAENAKINHARVLEEEGIARREALDKANRTNEQALEEARHKHEAQIHELSTEHNRTLQNAREDKERAESFLNERLSLADAKLQHFQDRTQHLEERLEVAKSAAQAAARNATSSRLTSPPAQPTAARSIGLPEKISPQALRESILVLQEQLQEREARIEQLQTEVDEEAPAKLKERDTEIAWLRELLAVRVEELTELINTLSRPTFNREMVRDVAIRIRANLQMEQQEKDRSEQSPPTLSGQALASISSIATPKAAQLSSAFNKWRSSMESSALKSQERRASSSRSYTPSKGHAGPPQRVYSSGLMTPPASNLRSSPIGESNNPLPPPQLHRRTGSKSSYTAPSRSYHRQPSSEGPATPLFREQNYDEDAAEDNSVHMQAFEDDDLDVADSEPPAFRSLEAELGQDDNSMDSEN